ncbi:MAG: DUF2723 domain-containing protein [Desulfobacteraceae bacterium]|nr:MAG: DUF2723 domain-containing protein [Desulfobacteraceae bacterium]
MKASSEYGRLMRSPEGISFYGPSFDSVYVGLGSFLVYLWTICPTVYVGDSGELTAAAHSLGIPHNSGYPLYVLIGKIFCLIPLGNIGFRMNLMSALFTALSVAILHDMILRVTASRIASLGAALFLSFTTLFWLQAVSAEVYSLHLFFVAAIFRLTWWWDQKREIRRLMLLAFVSGLSFGNHMQTVMLGPAILFLILHHERLTIFRLRSFALLCFLFILALSIYLYLPLRTNAGAAITWGDPNTLGRFLAHVTARSHRGVYVLNKEGWEYLQRALQESRYLFFEFGFLAFFALWGWLRSLDTRWRVFSVLILISDFFYTVFLNTISLEITVFGQVTAFLLTLLCGLGIADILSRVNAWYRIGAGVTKGFKYAFSCIPLFPLFFSYGACDQSRNYTGYEHAMNILRTPEEGSILLIDGDNNVFPVVYAAICEGMGDHVKIIDQYSLIFRWPSSFSEGEAVSLKGMLEKMVQENAGRPVYLSTFDPHVFPLPENYRLVPNGILMRAQGREYPFGTGDLRSLWAGYSTLSFYEPMVRDYMNRQVCGYFHFYVARYLFQTGNHEKGLEAARLASAIGYNDGSLHSDLGLCLTRFGHFREAADELELALLYAENVSVVYNNFGYHHEAAGEYEKAAKSLHKAVELDPRNKVYLNNLGFVLQRIGRREEAISAFRRSLEIDGDQSYIRSLLEGLSGSSTVGSSR